MISNFCETLRINSLSSIPPYDRSHRDDYCCISIGQVDNRYGILDEEGEELIPFEFDNITVLSFGLLQLSSKGKLGLLHLTQNDKGNPICVKKQINCEYDVVERACEGAILLIKYGMPNELFYGRSVTVYLPKPSILSEEYSRIEILSKEYGRSMLSLRRNQRESIVSMETGKEIIGESEVFTIGGYDTENATVLQQEYEGSSRLLYVGKNKIKEFSFSGMSAYAVTGINEDGIPYATGFIVECSSGYMLLDDTLCPLSRSVFPRLSVHNEITVRDSKGNAVIFPLKRQGLRIAEMQ